MKNKRGAIELSVTTIIIVVIGITLLILGLTWVRGIFSNLEGLSDTTFKKAQSLIGELENVNSLLTIIPTSTSINQEGDDAVKVVIANFKESPISVSITASTSDEDLSCGFLDGKNVISTIGPFELSSGSQKSGIAIIKDKSGPIRTTSCKITVSGDESDDATIIIKIEKKQGGIFASPPPKNL